VLDVTLRKGRLAGTLRLNDPAAHLTMTLARFTRLALPCQGMLRVDGIGRAGRRTAPFSLSLRLAAHSWTVDAAAPALRYHLRGVLHGHPSLVLTHAAKKKGAGTRVPPPKSHSR
jgi:hypothetical protein